MKMRFPNIAPLFLFAICEEMACSPKPAPLPPPDQFDQTQSDAGVAEDIADGTAESKTVIGRACDNLATLKCVEGLKRPAGDTCYESIKHIIDGHLTKFDTQCVVDAKTQAAVRLCKGASCTSAK